MIGVERDGAVAVVTVDRQEALNALDPPTLGELRDRLAELAGDGDVRAVVLTGAGERAFVAGADIKAMSAMDIEQARAWGNLGHETATLLETMPKPTIAAVNGFALGGGCELALACDVRYASTAAKLGQPEVSIGIIPGWGGTQRLPRVVGIGRAKELIMTGRLVDAEEAFRIGLVNAVFAPEELMEKSLELARELAAKSPLVLAAAKQAMNRTLYGDLGAEAEAFAGLFGSEDQREGMTAFIEKREPRFSGRLAASTTRPALYATGRTAAAASVAAVGSVSTTTSWPRSFGADFAPTTLLPRSTWTVSATPSFSGRRILSSTAPAGNAWSFVTFIVSCPVAAWMTLPVTVSVTVVVGDVAKISRSAFIRYGYGFAAPPSLGCTSKWRCGSVLSASPELPT